MGKNLIWRTWEFPFGETHQGCKILLTSRDQNVLSIAMDSQKKDFGVGILREDRSLGLVQEDGRR